MTRWTENATIPEVQERAIIMATQHWLSTMVIGLNFCPFAKREYEGDRIHYVIVDACEPQDLLMTLQAEWQRLDQQPEIATTLLIIPYGYEGFMAYLDLVDAAEQVLVMAGYEGIYQLASFHPDYCFADAEQQDPANYTNRSPYPMLHLLREAQLSHVLASHPNPDAIPQANIDKARAMGQEQLEALRAACFTGPK